LPNGTGWAMSTDMRTTTSDQDPILVLFPKDCSEEEIEAGLIAVQEAFPSIVKLVDSHTWFLRSFSICGDYDSWAAETVQGIQYQTRRPHFRGFVVYGEGTVPAGNAKIVKGALATRRPVLCLTESVLRVVKGLTESPLGYNLMTHNEGGSHA
jgi:hypothetical protein